jgi:hypothetical protein
MLLMLHVVCSYASHGIMLILVVLHSLDCVHAGLESGIQEEQIQEVGLSTSVKLRGY